jgi:hypothetical protein
MCFPIGSYVKLSSSLAVISDRTRTCQTQLWKGDHPRPFVTKFGSNSPSSFCREDLKYNILSVCIYIFVMFVCFSWETDKKKLRWLIKAMRDFFFILFPQYTVIYCSHSLLSHGLNQPP